MAGLGASKTYTYKDVKKKKNLYLILAIKKNEIMPFAATWMDLEIIILSEKSDRERQIPYDIPYM